MENKYEVVISVQHADKNDKRLPLERKMIVTPGNVDINASVESMIDTFEEGNDF